MEECLGYFLGVLEKESYTFSDSIGAPRSLIMNKCQEVSLSNEKKNREKCQLIDSGEISAEIAEKTLREFLEKKNPNF